MLLENEKKKSWVRPPLLEDLFWWQGEQSNRHWPQKLTKWLVQQYGEWLVQKSLFLTNHLLSSSFSASLFAILKYNLPLLSSICSSVILSKCYLFSALIGYVNEVFISFIFVTKLVCVCVCVVGSATCSFLVSSFSSVLQSCYILYVR